MNKEPIGLILLRYLCYLGILCFLGMLYWSSLLIEEDLRGIHEELAQLKGDQTSVYRDSDKDSEDKSPPPVLNNNASDNEPKNSLSQAPLTSRTAPQRKQIDPALPNLLTEDPFYANTLPKLLGKGFKPAGQLKQDTLGKPDNLHPFTNWSTVRAWQTLCSDNLAELHFGKYEVYAPSMAIKIEERPSEKSDGSEFWIHLRDDLFWAPLKQEFFPNELVLAPQFLKKQPLTAHDFKFYFDAMMNPYVQMPGAVALRTYYSDIDHIRVIDDHTFVVKWKTHAAIDKEGKAAKKIKYMARSLTFSMPPLPFFVYGYFADGKKIIEDDSETDVYRNNIAWAQNFTDHWARNIIVSCGPWLFDGMTEREIRFKRNPDYFQATAALAQSMTVQFRESSQSIWQDFKSNRIDNYNLQPDQLAELNDFLDSNRYREQEKKDLAIKRLDYLARSYAYLGWNETKPFFKSKKVRQALTMAIDRERIIQQNLNNLGVEISCPFYRYSTSYDPDLKPWPFDMQGARQMLEEDGWYDRNGNGIISKKIEGKLVPFRFSLIYYVKNMVSKNICEYISTTLKELGIECTLNGVDLADLSAAFDDKSFDAICLGWALGTPPEDLRQLWHSSGAKEKGSSNAIGFANADVDKIIEALDYEYDDAERQKLYYRFDKIFHDEAPYTLIYSPKIAFLYRQYLQNVFIPVDRQDLVPGANVAEPDSRIFWLKQ